MKNNLKTNLISYIITIIFAISISVTAATYFPSSQTTYNNEATGMSATNVQTAIDELYETCTRLPAGEQIIVNGELEKDPYECRYFFTGANPNNYITFNGENAGWRIISVECDGTIKIIKNKSVTDTPFDSSTTTDNHAWNRPNSLSSYLEGTYYKSLTTIAKNQLYRAKWNIGKPNFSDIKTTIGHEQSSIWTGNIGVITASEYVRVNSNISKCGSIGLANGNYKKCASTNWIYNNFKSNNPGVSYMWTMSWYNRPDGSPHYAFIVHIDTIYPGMLDSNLTWQSHTGAAPALYLKSSVVIIGGTGTESDPYVIV